MWNHTGNHLFLKLALSVDWVKTWSCAWPAWINHAVSERGSLSFPLTGGDSESCGFMICRVEGLGENQQDRLAVHGLLSSSPLLIYQVPLQMPPAFHHRFPGSPYQSIRVGSCGEANIACPWDEHKGPCLLLHSMSSRTICGSCWIFSRQKTYSIDMGRLLETAKI